MVPFVACCWVVFPVRISFTHIFTSWNSSYVIVFVSSLGHLFGPVLLPGFKHIATYFIISWLVSSFLKRPVWCSAVLYVSIGNLPIKGRMPISPLLCLQFVNCQHCWQKATNSRLICSTVAWDRRARVLLHCLYLERCHLAPNSLVSMVNPRLAPGGPD